MTIVHNKEMKSKQFVKDITQNRNRKYISVKKNYKLYQRA